MKSIIEKYLNQLPKLMKLLSILCLGSWLMIYFSNESLKHFEFHASFEKIVLNTTVFLSLLNFITWCFNRRYLNVVVAISFLLISLIISKSVNDDRVLRYVLICMAVSNLKVKNCLWIFVAVISVLFSYIVLNNLLEISIDVFVGFRNDGFRYSFGFVHPNTVGAIIFFLSITFWTIFRNKYSHLLFIAINACLYLFLVKFVDSRTSELSLIIASIIFLVLFIFDSVNDGLKNRIKKIFSVLLPLVFPLLSIVIVYIYCFYDPQSQVLSEINSLFSGRIGLCHNAIIKYGISWFGKSVVDTDSDPLGFAATATTAYEFTDNFYIYALLRWGIVSLVLYGLAFFIVVKNAVENGFYKIAVALSLFSVYAIMEVCSFTVTYNVLILLTFVDFKKFAEKFALPSIITNISKFLWKCFRRSSFIFEKLYLIIVGIAHFAKFVIVNNFVEIKYDNTELKKKYTASKSVFSVVFYLVIIVWVSVFFTNLIDYCKTVSTLLCLPDIYSSNINVLIFVILAILLLIFLKSLYYVAFYGVFKNKLSLSCHKSLKFIFTVSLCSVLAVLFVAVVTMHQGAKNRADDLKIAQEIVNEVKSQDLDLKVYVDKVPSLYKSAGLDVSSKTVFFDSVFLDKTPNLVFADPNDEHIVLFNNGYKFAKLSETLSLYVKDEKLQNIVENNGIVLSSQFTCYKALNLKRIAYMNKVKYRHGELFIQNKEHPILMIDPLYLTPGKYKFTLDFHYDENAVPSDIEKLFSFDLTSNNGSIKLIHEIIVIDKKSKGLGTVTFDLSLDVAKHSVNMQIRSYIMQKLNFSKIAYEKYE